MLRAATFRMSSLNKAIKGARLVGACSLLCAAACGAEQSATSSTGGEGRDASTAARTAAPLAAVVTHAVTDYAPWKAGFDAHQKAREEAGITAHCLNRLLPEDNTISAYFLASDQAKLEALFAAPETAAAMKAAGVVGPPTILLVRQQEDSTIWDRPLAAAIVVHDVEDYDSWKQGFDAHADARKSAGVIAHAINRSVEEPNRVVAMLQAESVESLRSFFAAPELAAAMKQAGVQGTPHVTFVNTVERVDY